MSVIVLGLGSEFKLGLGLGLCSGLGVYCKGCVRFRVTNVRGLE